MGADHYTTFTFFGYIIQIPTDTTYRKYGGKLYGLNGVIGDSFEITGMLSEFHSRMEGASYEEIKELDDDAQLIIGFCPSADLTILVDKAAQLSEYITDNPIFEGIKFSEKPKFISGIDWFQDIESYEDEDEDNDDDDDDEDDDDDDDDDEEDKDTSDEDAPQHEIKSD